MRRGFKKSELLTIRDALLACGMAPPVDDIDVWLNINPDHPLDKKYDLYKVRFQKGDKHAMIGFPAIVKWDTAKVKKVLMTFFGGKKR